MDDTQPTDEPTGEPSDEPSGQSDEQPGDQHEAFVLEWLTGAVPHGVTTAWTPDAPEAGDDDEREAFTVADEAWDEARHVLLEDQAVAQARQAVGERFGASYERVTVWLTLRDGVEEPDIAIWAPDGDDEDDDEQVVLHGVTDAADLRELDPTERTDAYLELVTGLLQVALDD